MSIEDVVLEEGVVITHSDLVHLVGCTIGAGSRVGPFVEILRDTTVGRHCKISSHSSICSGVSIGDGVFIGHGVVITDTPAPAGPADDPAEPASASPKKPRTHIGSYASIGSRATIRAGCQIGEGALVGAGAVVMSDVPCYTIAVGNPARLTSHVPSLGAGGASRRTGGSGRS